MQRSELEKRLFDAILEFHMKQGTEPDKTLIISFHAQAEFLSYSLFDVV